MKIQLTLEISTWIVVTIYLFPLTDILQSVKCENEFNNEFKNWRSDQSIPTSFISISFNSSDTYQVNKV